MSCACSCAMGSALCWVVTTKTETAPASAMPTMAMAMMSSRSDTPSSLRARLMHIPCAGFDDQGFAAADGDGLAQVRNTNPVEAERARGGVGHRRGSGDLVLGGACRPDEGLVAHR